MFKKTTFILLAIMATTLAAITILEKTEGEDLAYSIYHSVPFGIAWTLTTLLGVISLIHNRLWRFPSIGLLHLSFLVILLGAGVTFITGQQGYISLRIGNPTSIYHLGNDEVDQLPFIIGLDQFSIKTYPGTDMPADYESHVTIKEEETTTHFTISMNHILSYKGYRFYQNSFDEDLQGSLLSISHDPAGVAISYIGYLLLAISSIWILTNRHGTFRTSIRKLNKKSSFHSFLLTITIVLAGWTYSEKAQAAMTLPSCQADEMGKTYIMRQGYICNFETLAVEFTQKLTGDNKYKNLDANQVLCGWLIDYNGWQYEKIIRIKSKEIQQILNVGEWTSVYDLYDKNGQYKLSRLTDMSSKLSKDILELNEKLGLIQMIGKGELLAIFPIKSSNGIKWYAPTSQLPKETSHIDSLMVRNFLNVLSQKANAGESCTLLINKFHKYQTMKLGTFAPSPLHNAAEHFNNKYNYLKPLSIATLTIGLAALLIVCIYSIKEKYPFRHCEPVFQSLMLTSFILLSLLLSIRIYLSGRLPLSNGYETMLLVAWLSQGIAIPLCRKEFIILPFGMLLSGFAMLVASIGSMNPQITQLMPVLHSPWLSFHVSMMMISYTLLGYMALGGLTCIGMVLTGKQKNRGKIETQIERLSLISRILTYPAVLLLALGIFSGAVWANVSWGTYWSWDPKETWALITFILYSMTFHARTIHWLNDDFNFQLYLTFAFLSVLMTYFGVNYVLGGMHSYAGVNELNLSALLVAIVIFSAIMILIVFSWLKWKSMKEQR